MKNNFDKLNDICSKLERENADLRRQLAEANIKAEARCNTLAAAFRAEIDGKGGWRELCKGHEQFIADLKAQLETAARGAMGAALMAINTRDRIANWPAVIALLKAALAPEETKHLPSREVGGGPIPGVPLPGEQIPEWLKHPPIHPLAKEPEPAAEMMVCKQKHDCTADTPHTEDATCATHGCIPVEEKP